jgi:uncharacterized protein YjbJ (UPF0337 family)
MAFGNRESGNWKQDEGRLKDGLGETGNWKLETGKLHEFILSGEKRDGKK